MGLQLPQGGRYPLEQFFQLVRTFQIPIGSTIKAEDGEVQLTTASDRGRGRKHVSASLGRFTVASEAADGPSRGYRLREGSQTADEGRLNGEQQRSRRARGALRPAQSSARERKVESKWKANTAPVRRTALTGSPRTGATAR